MFLFAASMALALLCLGASLIPSRKIAAARLRLLGENNLPESKRSLVAGLEKTLNDFASAVGRALPGSVYRAVSASARRYTHLVPDPRALAGERLLHALLSCTAALLLFRFSPEGFLVSALCAACGYHLPLLRLKRAESKRSQLLAMQLPGACELIYSYLVGGKNLDQAFRLTCSSLPEPLGGLLGRAQREMDLGSSRKDAFQKLERECADSDLSFLLRLLVEAERRGYPLTEVLSIYSRDLRLKRNLEARRRANLVPLKMLFPLVFLILPASVLLTVGPTFLLMFSGKR